MFKSRVSACVLGLVAMFLAGDAMAIREGGFGNAPVKDQNWRVGATDVANLKSRIAYWHGPTSETQSLYRGNTEAFAEAIRLFGLIRAPDLELYVHDWPHEEWSLKPANNETDPEARKRDPRVDWTFLIHDAQEWYRCNLPTLHASNPIRRGSSDSRSLSNSTRHGGVVGQQYQMSAPQSLG